MLIGALAFTSIGILFAAGDIYTKWFERKNDPVYYGLLLFASITLYWPLIVLTLSPQKLHDWFRKRRL